MPRKKKPKVDYHNKVDELHCAGAVLRSGMPQATIGERRAMRARHTAVMGEVASLRRSRVFVSRK